MKPSAAQPTKLVVRDDKGELRTIAVARADKLTIGRDEANEVHLPDITISRRHACLSREDGAFFVEDLASYNGVKVNGNRINGRTQVEAGDRIQIGDYMLWLEPEGGFRIDMPTMRLEKE